MKRNRTVIMNILIVIGGKLWACRLWIWLLGSWHYNLCITFWFITIPRRFRRGNIFKYPKCTIWLRLWGNKNSIIYLHILIENCYKCAEYLNLLSLVVLIFQEFEEISEEAKNFIESLLLKQKRKRLSAKECLDHHWLAKTKHNQRSVPQFTRINTVNHKKFVVRRRWQKCQQAIR